MDKKTKEVSFTKEQLLEMLLRLNEKVNNSLHISSDNNDLIMKLITQNNTLLKYLSSIEIEEVPMDEYTYNPPQIKADNEKSYMSLRELIDEFMSKRDELKEFEEELKKNKDKLTPGQVGEA